MCQYHKELLRQIKKLEIISQEYKTNMANVLEKYESSFLECEICKKLQLKEMI